MIFLYSLFRLGMCRLYGARHRLQQRSRIGEALVYACSWYVSSPFDRSNPAFQDFLLITLPALPISQLKRTKGPSSLLRLVHLSCFRLTRSTDSSLLSRMTPHRSIAVLIRRAMQRLTGQFPLSLSQVSPFHLIHSSLDPSLTSTILLALHSFYFFHFYPSSLLLSRSTSFALVLFCSHYRTQKARH